MSRSQKTRAINRAGKKTWIPAEGPKSNVNQSERGKRQYISTSNSHKTAHFCIVFSNGLYSERRGGLFCIFHSVCGLIKDEQLCALGDAVFSFHPGP